MHCRPETMYGQTNCWALPDGDYAAFRGLDGEVYIMTDRSALNLSYQARTGVVQQCVTGRAAGKIGFNCFPAGVHRSGFALGAWCVHAPLASTSTDQLLSWLQDRMPVTGKPEKLMDLKGTDLLGLPVKVR